MFTSILETAKLTSSSQTDSSSVAFVESSFIAKRSPTSPTGAVSPMRNVVLPQHNQKSVVGNATGTTTLRVDLSAVCTRAPAYIDFKIMWASVILQEEIHKSFSFLGQLSLTLASFNELRFYHRLRIVYNFDWQSAFLINLFYDSFF